MLDGVLAVGTGLEWDFGELRLIPVTSSGYVDFRPYDLRELASSTLYADNPDVDDDILVNSEYQLVPRPGGTYYDMRVIAPSFAPAHAGFEAMISIRGWWGMTVVPGGQRILALVAGNKLFALDSVLPNFKPAAVKISGLAKIEKIISIDQRPATDAIVGFSNQNRVYSINPNSGAATDTNPTNKAPAKAPLATTFPYGADNPLTTMNAGSIQPAGGMQPHSNMQPFLCINFIIATEGLRASPG